MLTGTQCRGKKSLAGRPRRPVDAISTRRAHSTWQHIILCWSSQYSPFTPVCPRHVLLTSHGRCSKPPKCLTPQSCRFRKIYEPLITALKGWHREVSRRVAALLSPCPRRVRTELAPIFTLQLHSINFNSLDDDTSICGHH
jgi:hypothetical protein